MLGDREGKRKKGTLEKDVYDKKIYFVLNIQDIPKNLKDNMTCTYSK
jgi:hypothetical protein